MPLGEVNDGCPSLAGVNPCPACAEFAFRAASACKNSAPGSLRGPQCVGERGRCTKLASPVQNLLKTWFGGGGALAGPACVRWNPLSRMGISSQGSFRHSRCARKYRPVRECIGSHRKKNKNRKRNYECSKSTHASSEADDPDRSNAQPKHWFRGRSETVGCDSRWPTKHTPPGGIVATRCARRLQVAQTARGKNSLDQLSDED